MRAYVLVRLPGYHCCDLKGCCVSPSLGGLARSANVSLRFFAFLAFVLKLLAAVSAFLSSRLAAGALARVFGVVAATGLDFAILGDFQFQPRIIALHSFLWEVLVITGILRIECFCTAPIETPDLRSNATRTLQR